jgi:hypothetical protein
MYFRFLIVTRLDFLGEKQPDQKLLDRKKDTYFDEESQRLIISLLIYVFAQMADFCQPWLYTRYNVVLK